MSCCKKIAIFFELRKIPKLDPASVSLPFTCFFQRWSLIGSKMRLLHETGKDRAATAAAD